MASRKRRRAVTWLPTIGTNISVEGPDNVSGREFTLAVAPETQVAITALTFDEPRDPDQDAIGDTTLADFVGSEYMLKRIVGKLFIAYSSPFNVAGEPLATLVGAGFFVARAGDPAQDETLPIGATTLAERQENYNPLSEDCIREPWIWRRTWVLGAGGALAGDGIDAERAFPTTTAGYGSMADGPHIDAQTMRRVTSDERLWFALSTVRFPVTAGGSGDGSSIRGYLDYRLLGSLMKARNRGVF